jgi:hypothetical protein
MSNTVIAFDAYFGTFLRKIFFLHFFLISQLKSPQPLYAHGVSLLIKTRLYLD